MQGRYGTDKLNQALLYLALGVMIVNVFVRNPAIHRVLYYVGVIALIIGYFRMLSRNYSKRAEENRKFLALQDKVLALFGRKSNPYGRGTYRTNTAGQPDNVRIFKCPQCKQKIRVPKGKGKIEITCPKCKMAFIRRS